MGIKMNYIEKKLDEDFYVKISAIREGFNLKKNRLF